MKQMNSPREKQNSSAFGSCGKMGREIKKRKRQTENSRKTEEKQSNRAIIIIKQSKKLKS